MVESLLMGSDVPTLFVMQIQKKTSKSDSMFVAGQLETNWRMWSRRDRNILSGNTGILSMAGE